MCHPLLSVTCYLLDHLQYLSDLQKSEMLTMILCSPHKLNVKHCVRISFGFSHTRFKSWCMNTCQDTVSALKTVILHFTTIFCRSRILETANKNTAFSDKDWHTANAQHDTNTSSRCPHMECVENFSNENCILLGYYVVLMYFAVEASNHKLMKCPS